MDYSKYEGMEVVYKRNKDSKKTYIGIVTGCDKNLGLSIQNKEDMEEYLVCMNGPMSPLTRGAKYHEDDMYFKQFDYIIKSLEEGSPIYIEELRKLEKPNDDPLLSLMRLVGITTEPSAETCVFAQ